MFKRSCSSLLLLLFPCLLGMFMDRAQARPPNVILIMADDLGYQDLGCYGHPSIRTPVLDGLARHGTRLTDYHSGATVCTPSRMALMTGAYPTRLGWTQGVVGYLMGMHDGLHPDALTIAEVFKSERYATAIFGKWHIGDQPDTRPTAQGFDYGCYLTHSNNQDRHLWHGDEVDEQQTENRLLSETFTEAAVRFVRANSGKPFFLYLPYTAPHFPVEPHPDWSGRSQYGKYGDVVEEMDSRIGELLGAIKETGLEHDTIVIFTSDNGPNPHQPSGCFPLRGEKWSALEGGTRVPCIISWPGTIPAGKVCDRLFSAMDWLPTLSRACGIDWQTKTNGRPRIDGLDLWDLLLGKDGAVNRTELFYWHGKEGEPKAFRSHGWKLFYDGRDALEGLGTERITPEQEAKIAPYRIALKSAAAASPMLFNLNSDPGETEDLSSGNTEKIETLTARSKELLATMKADGTLPIAKPQNGH